MWKRSWCWGANGYWCFKIKLPFIFKNSVVWLFLYFYVFLNKSLLDTTGQTLTKLKSLCAVLVVIFSQLTLGRKRKKKKRLYIAACTVNWTQKKTFKICGHSKWNTCELLLWFCRVFLLVEEFYVGKKKKKGKTSIWQWFFFFFFDYSTKGIFFFFIFIFYTNGFDIWHGDYCEYKLQASE